MLGITDDLKACFPNDYKKVKLVMDRGYYSADKINGLYKQHYKLKAGRFVHSHGCNATIRQA